MTVKDGIKRSYRQYYNTISNLPKSILFGSEAARGEKLVGEVPLPVESEGSGSCEGGALP